MSIVIELEQKVGTARYLDFAVEGGRHFEVLAWQCEEHAHAVIQPEHYPPIRGWWEVSEVEKAVVVGAIKRELADVV